MAIFGDLSDLPFPEVLNMLGHRTGRLRVSERDHPQPVEVHLREGLLQGVIADGQLIEDAIGVRDRLSSLIDAASGSFEFHRTAVDELRGSLQLSVPQLLLSIAAAVDEISHYRDRFAHPQTVFAYGGRPDVWLDEELFQFLEQAKPRLLQGVDAEELARELGLSLDQVQLKLYKLRSVGRVAPLRAFEATRRTAGAASPPAADAASPPAADAASPPAVSAGARLLATPATAVAGAAGSVRGIFSSLLKSLRSRIPA